MKSTPTDVLAADCNGVELVTTQRQSFAVAEKPSVQAFMARVEPDEMVRNQLEKPVKEVVVLVMAEIAKNMRTSNPHREAIEEVGRAAVDTAMVLVRKVRLRYKECAVLDRLVGKAWHQYEALPRAEREGGFSVLVKALLRKTRTEAMNDKIAALCEVKRLKKHDRQSIAEFCVDLERLTCRAYSELNERASAIERAHLLYQPIVHWLDSYRLLEALEEEDDPYTRDCSKSKRTDSTQHRTSLSSRLAEPACRAFEIGSPGVERKWKGLLDTGSEISIIHAKRLLKAKEDGFDIDHDVAEYPINKALRVYNASGHLMSSEREFDVTNTMHCLHVEFCCQGQRMPALPGVNLSDCNDRGLTMITLGSEQQNNCDLTFMDSWRVIKN
ncbi:unnamed protein product [Heligmosomoides polygyrus]|uniref:Peptidase A2 domain-containing protein n=1 Tax=Heligmosomoides polygyrus TaxID=6339 RepID=A0A183GMG5_HELPZ|nr:unnamed protein product [Heligmosomoides polygyrus]